MTKKVSLAVLDFFNKIRKRPTLFFEIVLGLALVISAGLLIFIWFQSDRPYFVNPSLPKETIFVPEKGARGPERPATSEVIQTTLPAIPARITYGLAKVKSESAKIFSYAHGTAVSGNKILIGMADKAGNAFSTNQLMIFDSLNLNSRTILGLPFEGDIETMVQDPLNGRVYFLFSGSDNLRLIGFEPRTNILWMIATSSLDVGGKPAIVTDGRYVYGITDTNPARVFRINLEGGEVVVSASAHIPNGHSAAIGLYASSTELYFGGGMGNGFEKVDPVSLEAVASIKITPCNMSDDMPFVQTASSSGYVYIGCEIVPYGIRINTADLTYERFSLPGASLGLFVFGDDLYNGAKDGMIDIFPGGDLKKLERYKVVGKPESFDSKGQDIEINEIFRLPESGRLYVTAWWGIKGLYEIATSTLN